MITIGLTGGIAAGKSVVAGLLGQRGATVVDVDKVAHETYRASTSGHAALVTAFRDLGVVVGLFVVLLGAIGPGLVVGLCEARGLAVAAFGIDPDNVQSLAQERAGIGLRGGGFER